MDVDTYIKQLEAILTTKDFYEYGFNYDVKRFESIASVNSEYEAKKQKRRF